MNAPQLLRRFLRPVAPLVRRFTHTRYCPCCRQRCRRFATHGLVPRPEARCPNCDALERHRLVWLYVNEKTDLADGRPKRMLHVAPEGQLTNLFRRLPALDYLSSDLSGLAMIQMDITDIQFPDSTFDVIYCSHVLEHVPDDAQAMRELRRVLKPDGWAILQVPITAPVTFEDPAATSPEERLRLFGQDDHVRRYGPDYADRLRAAGFQVTVDPFVRTLPPALVKRYGLVVDEDVYLCRK